ncbi:hypothetical protein C5746_31020 [Streptomyces atratus]|uniref:Uncharacterized protein n=1 Tax=Streptomyces atratus TaxID=1893 RepID=A0A2Z5JJU9_STRAR|nr:hypothetical protein C5746_31020 [Streptomyces atratus]
MIRDTDGRTLGYASHTPRDWVPREAFYAAYRSDEVLFAHYRATEEGGVVLDTDSDTDSPAGELPFPVPAPRKALPRRHGLADGREREPELRADVT